jgi:hypothetical protein
VHCCQKKLLYAANYNRATYLCPTNDGAEKFLIKYENANISIDNKKIDKDTQWDGLHDVITNIKNDSPTSTSARLSRREITY